MTIEQAIAIGGVMVLERMAIKEFRVTPLKARLATEKAIKYILENGVKVEVEQINQKGVNNKNVSKTGKTRLETDNNTNKQDRAKSDFVGSTN